MHVGCDIACKRPRSEESAGESSGATPARIPRTERFFTRESFEAWRELVLSELLCETSPIHAIVDRGALPVYSTMSKNWFGVTASLRYRRQPKPPPEVPKEQRRRWVLGDLLRSRNPMVGSYIHKLLDVSPGFFNVTVFNNFVINATPSTRVLQRSDCLVINNLYPRMTGIEWLRGGDLLHACGILFSLLDVNYMMVCEGPDLRRFEEIRREQNNDPGYFYYDKYILGAAQHVKKDFDDPPWFDRYSDENMKDADDYGEVQFYETQPERSPETKMECWLWEKNKPTT